MEGLCVGAVSLAKTGHMKDRLEKEGDTGKW